MDYKHTCLGCQSPCGYTGILSSADCSNPKCEFAEKKAVDPALYGPSILGPFLTRACTPTQPTQPAVPLLSLVHILETQICKAEFIQWLLGAPGMGSGPWAPSGDLLIGFHDSVSDPVIRRTPITDAFHYQVYPRGSAGWAPNNGSSLSNVHNTQPVSYMETQTRRSLTHLLLADSGTKVTHMFFRLPIFVLDPAHAPQALVAPGGIQIGF